MGRGAGHLHRARSGRAAGACRSRDPGGRRLVGGSARGIGRRLGTGVRRLPRRPPRRRSGRGRHHPRLPGGAAPRLLGGVGVEGEGRPPPRGSARDRRPCRSGRARGGRGSASPTASSSWGSRRRTRWCSWRAGPTTSTPRRRALAIKGHALVSAGRWREGSGDDRRSGRHRSVRFRQPEVGQRRLLHNDRHLPQPRRLRTSGRVDRRGGAIHERSLGAGVSGCVPDPSRRAEATEG